MFCRTFSVEKSVFYTKYVEQNKSVEHSRLFFPTEAFTYTAHRHSNEYCLRIISFSDDHSNIPSGRTCEVFVTENNQLHIHIYATHWNRMVSNYLFY